MRNRVVQIAVLTATLAVGAWPCLCQANSDPKALLSQRLGLSGDQIAAVQDGQPFARNLEPRSPAEIFVVGVIFVKAAPEAYVKFASDFDRLRKVPGYLAINQFSNPPQLSDLKGFEFTSDDIKGLKDCKPGNCVVQLPGSTMEALHNSINWSAPNADDQMNQALQKLAAARLTQYEKDGNRTLGAVYNDKKQQLNVGDQFKYMLSYAKALPQDLPEFYNYLLDYPEGKPDNVENSFYWDNVKFGLKPTLRIVHVLTMKGNKPGQPEYVIAEKQLYSSHYFETALDLTFLFRASDSANEPGFYLVRAMGSEQAGLTGFKGSMIRKVAVSHSVQDLQKSLAAIKTALERKP